MPVPMPSSWSNRFLPSTNASRPSDETSQAPTPRPHAHPPSQTYDQRQKDTHTAASVSASASPRQPKHNRSSSNPVPWLFGKQKSTAQGSSLQDLEDNLYIDESLVPTLEQYSAESPTKTTSGGKRVASDGPSVTRRCICCHNKVRYPRELVVFRCTSCLTINDLEHNRRDSANGDSHGKSEPSLSQRDRRAQPAQTLSVQRTKAIIHQCLQRYVQSYRPDNDAAKIPLDSISQRRPSVNQPERPPMVHAQSTNIPLSPHGRVPSTTSSPESGARSSSRPVPNFHLPMRPAFGNSRALSAPAQAQAQTPVKNSSSHPRVDTLQSTPRSNPNACPTSSSNSTHRAESSIVTSHAISTGRYDRAKKIFKPVEDYIVSVYGRHECLNNSFQSTGSKSQSRGHSESSIISTPIDSTDTQNPFLMDAIPQLDHKMLLAGDIAENGDWWSGRLTDKPSERAVSSKHRDKRKTSQTVVDWDDLDRWYECVHTAGCQWWENPSITGPHTEASTSNMKDSPHFHDMDADISIARGHVERVLLKVAENLLKRPGLPLIETDDLRFLIIILSNPSLYPLRTRQHPRSDGSKPQPTPAPDIHHALNPRISSKVSRATGQHTGILKRSFGLLACSPPSCHKYVVGWFCQMSSNRFIHLVDVVVSFVTYRLSRPPPSRKPRQTVQDGGLIPDLSGSAAQTSAQLQTAPGLSGASKRQEDGPQSVVDYSEDWQLKAAAKVMALLFAANNIWQGKNAKAAELLPLQPVSDLHKPRAHTHGQLLPTSDFYHTLLDYHDLVADFKAWESRLARFTFCQYPFFLSMGSKIKILEFDAKRQMENKARQAFFDSVVSSRSSDINFHMTVRRECMVDDSLRQISEAVGAGQEELKKGLRVHFQGEEGVDAGGLRKEWFLLLVREVFDPNHGMFLYDEDSHNCYFNPNSFETSDQYHLVGALLGLAIYNSTILDVALPSFAFRKLLAAAPVPTSALPSAGVKNRMTYTTADLAEYSPRLAAGLNQLLSYDGDVQSTFCQDFVVPVSRYGTVTNIPLCRGGENRPVTNSNRKEYVDLYVRYLLDTAVAKQFEPFKRGFYTVCAGSALSLFRAEEIELLVRGSEEALDVDALQAVAVYDNWRTSATPHRAIPDPADNVPVLTWFWDFFRRAQPQEQRKLLLFITGSDRIPAVGATSLVLKLVGGGDGTGKEEEQNGATDRFPIARTCFNMLVLWRYKTRAQMEAKLGRAILESEGFGLK